MKYVEVRLAADNGPYEDIKQFVTRRAGRKIMRRRFR